MNKNLCPNGHPMEKREASFAFRGRLYAVDFCPTCNSLWNCPPPEFEADWNAGVFLGTEPGDIVSGPPTIITLDGPDYNVTIGDSYVTEGSSIELISPNRTTPQDSQERALKTQATGGEE